MTAHNQPHNYRCETCAHFIGKMENAFGVDQSFCSNPKIVEYNKQKPETGGQISPTQWRIEDHYIMKKDLYFSPMSNFDVERISVLGCASHSSATKAEQRIADDLLKLIKDMGENDNCGPLWEMNSDECYSFNNSCALCKATKALALLRGREE